MQLLEIETGSSSMYRVVEEYTVSSPVLQLIGTALPRNSGIPVSGGNPSSYVRAVSSSSTPSAQPDRQL